MGLIETAAVIVVHLIVIFIILLVEDLPADLIYGPKICASCKFRKVEIDVVDILVTSGFWTCKKGFKPTSDEKCQHFEKRTISDRVRDNSGILSVVVMQMILLAILVFFI